MKIQSVGKDNTNFKRLYAPKKLNFYNFGNISQKELLKKVPELKKCSEEYDVKMTPKLTTRVSRNDYHNGKLGDIVSNSMIALGMFGSMFAVGALSPFSVLPSLGLTILGGFCGGLAGAFFGVMAEGIVFPKRLKIGHFDMSAEKNYSEGDKVVTKTTSAMDINDIGVVINNINSEIEAADQMIFLKKLARICPDGIYDTKTILQVLENKNIKSDFGNSNLFCRNIDFEGGNTLLTRFFEIKRNEANAEEYDKIANIIKSTPDINFEQKDRLGISIIENILNSENFAALDIVKDFEFEYSKDLDVIFNNIKNTEFKEKACKLKIKFNDLCEIYEKNGVQALLDNISQLDSPFIDSQRIAMDLWAKIAIEHRNQMDDLDAMNKCLYKYLPTNLRME